MRGVREGFRVGFDGRLASNQGDPARNMPSARERPEVIDDYLAEECSKGRVLAPLSPALFPFVHTSRFRVIPKGTTGKWRLIVDMSFPKGSSVNDGIREAVSSLTYVGIGDAMKVIVQLGKGTLLEKADIKSAYRNVPVHHPADRWLMMGMRWRKAPFIDTPLPFGLRSAPKLFTAIADGAEWIARKEGVRFVMHYLDDFLVLGAPGSEECSTALKKLLEVFEKLGLPVAPEKSEGPDTKLTFQGKKSCSMKELESLVGKLAHASQVVQSGKTFMRRMFELNAVRGRSQSMVRLNCGFKSDIMWWATFLETWNGVSMKEPGSGQATVEIWTDASGGWGCGAWHSANKEWIQLG